MTRRGAASTGGSSAEYDSLFHESFEVDGGPGAHAAPSGWRARREAATVGHLLDEQAHEVVHGAVRATVEWSSGQLDSTHLLWSATQTPVTRAMLAESGVDNDELAASLHSRGHAQARHAARDAEMQEDALDDVEAHRRVLDESGRPALTPAARRVLLGAHQQALAESATTVGARHVVLALAADAESAAGRVLARAIEDGEQRRSVTAPVSSARGGTPRLDEYSLDLTDLARSGKLDPVLGRDDVIEQAVEVLARRSKNNPVLVGDPGVGKTAVVEGLAQRIADEEVPPVLSDKRVLSLDLAGLVAGSKYRGEFEQRLREVLDEIRTHGSDVVVFIDELHTVVGAGAGEGTMDAGTMLKPPLARGELLLVGATTFEEYRKRVESDPALERRFQPIRVPEPEIDAVVDILRGLRTRYQDHHRVRLTDEALVAASHLSARYLPERFLPDKAIDLVDQACARLRLQHAGDDSSGRRPVARAEDVAEVVSRRTGIPTSQLTSEERERLLRLEDVLRERVVGQEEAVRAVAEAVRRTRAGLGDPDRPVGSFLFLGPTGVGKTELARALATALFGNAEQLLRFDMSEFQEQHAVSRLIGAPPGYVGYGEAGQLTEAVRRRPYSVVLFDEIEKAHPDVFNALLQLLDAGRLTDAQGRTVDFRDTVVIMTSNLGSEFVLSGEVSPDELRDPVMAALGQHFRPEFVNRVDEVITFRALGTDELRRITSMLLERTRGQLQQQGVQLELSADALTWLSERGHQPEFGARPLKRVIRRELDNRLAELLLSATARAGQRIVVTVQDDELAVRVSAGGSEAEHHREPRHVAGQHAVARHAARTPL